MSDGDDKGQIRALPGKRIEDAQARLRELAEGPNPPRAVILLAIGEGGDLQSVTFGVATNSDFAWAGAYLLHESQN